MTAPPSPLFPNYLQLRQRSRLPAGLWRWVRVASVLAVLGLVALMFARPADGLFLLWRLIVPILPLVFLLVPGLWRNACPLAAVNQTPRLFGLSRGLTPPAWWNEYGYVIGFGLFFLFASSRKWLFNPSGAASGWLVLGLLAAAFIGGLLFKGKSGWCSSICPLYPVQRLYNQTPFITLPNAHCDPCVGCTKNCYDFNPGVAYLADLYDDDRYYSSYRKFFAAAMPGFIIAFFSLPNPPQISLLSLYAGFGLYISASAGIFYIADSFLKVSANKLTAVCGATALNLFYWFGLPAWLQAVGSLAGFEPPLWLARLLQVAILGITLAWIYRTYAKERLFLTQLLQPEETRVASGAALVLKQATSKDKTEVTFMPGEVRILAEQGRTLLEIAESNHQPIEAGCRMGVCGADPVAILSGMENLSAIGSDEKATLERLGLGENVRMACMCRVKGTVSISTNARQAAAAGGIIRAANLQFDPAIQKVVIIGNGIAGVTAADYIRRNHPDCEIHLVGREIHPLYNRMAISRLIYGRSAMEGLYLQPASWYEEHKIICWLNTQALSIDRQERIVHLATGEALPYDRLILASGSSSFVPPLPGAGLPGSFVLREAEEAMGLRAYAQAQRCRTAVVAGGGLLGLEAAYAIHKLGLKVTVLERGEWLLRRQLDQHGSHFLRQYLEALGMDIVARAEASAVYGGEQVEAVVLNDGRELKCNLFLLAVGIQPNIELAQAAGLDVRRGVRVNANMCTSDPNIFAAGDVVEYNGQLPGLWSVAVEQARVAALSALGQPVEYHELIPVTTLKVVGVDMTSIGRFESRPEDTVIVHEEVNQHRYRKLVISQGKIVGAILLGYPRETPAVTAAVKDQVDVTDKIEALQAGDWSVLSAE